MMQSRVEEAANRHKKGYNCAQAVACAYCDLVGVDEETMFRVTEGLGLGMGSMEGTCGAISGACVVAGAKISTARLDAPDSKRTTYGYSKEIMTRFKEESGSVVCKELKGKETGRPIKPCQECVRDAARILEEVLFSDSDKM